VIYEHMHAFDDIAIFRKPESAGQPGLKVAEGGDSSKYRRVARIEQRREFTLETVRLPACN